MAQTVDISFVPALQDQIINLYQEAATNIRSTVRVRNITGKTDKWERLGGTELEQVTTRHQATPHTPFTHSARLAVLLDFAGSEKLDQLDQVKMMIDPKSDYTQGLVNAWSRRVARSVVGSLNGAALSVDNQDARTSNSFPASQTIANGGTGFTMAKWRQANRLLDNAGVPRGDRSVLISAYGVEDLMADATVTSADYTSLAAVQSGTVDGAMLMGAKVILISDAVPDETSVEGASVGTPVSPILPKSGNIRTCFLYHKSAVGLSIAKDVSAEVDRLPEHLNAWQVLVQGSLGAVRILDAGVVSIDIDETA